MKDVLNDLIISVIVGVVTFMLSFSIIPLIIETVSDTRFTQVNMEELFKMSVLFSIFLMLMSLLKLRLDKFK